MRISHRITAEFLGTAFLLAAIVGSGIMGERLAAGNAAVALLANSVATGAMLVVLIVTLGPVSGAHFNPLVTFANCFQGGLSARHALSYLLAQVAGALAGVASANYMFGLSAFQFSQHTRAGMPQLFSEFVATFGLLLVILVCAKFVPQNIAFTVAAYITAAYWFTSSTSFANPAVTLARSLTDTFAGIRPVDVPGFIAAQVLGGACGVALFQQMIRKPAQTVKAATRGIA
jgi:glycerol uptake facilitator-like aquaporin